MDDKENKNKKEDEVKNKNVEPLEKTKNKKRANSGEEASDKNAKRDENEDEISENENEETLEDSSYENAQSDENEEEGGISVFKAAYIDQKNENESQEKGEETEKTADPAERKFKILTIILIVITAALLLSSSSFLIYKAQKPASEGDAKKPQKIVNTDSASFKSPFHFQQKYTAEFPEGMDEKFKDLYQQNSDFAGWLSVPGTNIDTPVYQADKAGYYLKRNNYGSYDRYGIPYLDENCGLKELSRNSTIYGHNFSDQQIFDQLENYESVDFFKKHPLIEFNTIYGDYKWKIIAAFRSNGEKSGDNGYLFYYIAPDMNDDSFMKYYDEIQQRSYIHTGVDVKPDDKVITLSTCTYFFDKKGVQNARFVVVGRLIRDGESEKVDVSKAEKNDNVRYPQLYYNVFGGTNPWRNSSKWTAYVDAE